MVDSSPQFEITDAIGTTIHVNGPAGVTTPIDIPTVGTTKISDILFMADPSFTPSNGKVELSFDGGTTWFPIFQGGSLSWSPRGGITQFKLKASTAGLKYYIIINRELD